MLSGGARATPEHVWKWKLKHRFGLSPEDYQEILDAQKGVCGICKKTPEENGKRLAVDHDHATGDIRGLLCGSCNLSLGVLGDHLPAALKYLGVGE